VAAQSGGFGADAADLLTMDGAVSDDVTASIANDAAKLPAGVGGRGRRLPLRGASGLGGHDRSDRALAGRDNPAGTVQPRRPAAAAAAAADGW